MAFTEIAELKGFNRRFKVSPEARPYTLRDNGFVNTKAGNFIYERAMETESQAKFVLKVTVDKQLTGVKISTVSENGLNAVDVMKLSNNDMVVEKINFIFDGFVDRNCLVEV